MAEEKKSARSRGIILNLSLAFLVVFLAVRISAVDRDRDEAHEASAALLTRTDTAEKEVQRARASESLALDRLVAQEARERTLQKIHQEHLDRVKVLTAEHAAAAVDHEKQVAALGTERDAASAKALDAADRLRSLQTVLVEREAALAKAREEIRRLSDPSEVERAQVLLGSDDARVRAIGIERLAGLAADPGAHGACRAALRSSRSVAEALSILRASGDPPRLAREEAGTGSVVARRAVARVLDDRGRLLALLGDTDAPVRAAAAARIGGLGLADAASALRKASRDTDVPVRSAVALALAQIGDFDAVAPLLADEDVRVARCALAGFVAAGKALPQGVEVHEDLASAVALSRRLLSGRPGSD